MTYALSFKCMLVIQESPIWPFQCRFTRHEITPDMKTEIITYLIRSQNSNTALMSESLPEHNSSMPATLCLLSTAVPSYLTLQGRMLIII